MVQYPETFSLTGVRGQVVLLYASGCSAPVVLHRLASGREMLRPFFIIRSQIIHVALGRSSILDDSITGILYNVFVKTFDEILHEAEHLPLEQRLSLAHRLLVSSEPTSTPDVEKAWDLVIRERIARYEQGQAQSRPASEVFSELDHRLST